MRMIWVFTGALYFLVFLVVARTLAGHFAWKYLVSQNHNKDAPETFDWWVGWIEGVCIAWAWLPIGISLLAYWLCKRIPVYRWGYEREGIERLREKEHADRAKELEVPVS